MCRWVAITLVGTAALLAVAADPPKADRDDDKDRADKARMRFFSEWLIIELREGGTKITDPEKLAGRQYTPDQVVGWSRRGEMQTWVEGLGPRVDTTVTPMRVDFRLEGFVDSFPGGRAAREDEKLVRVIPCIFKFEDGNLVIAEGDTRVPEKELKKGEDYPGRPTDFTSTKENKRRVLIMKPSAVYLQD